MAPSYSGVWNISTQYQYASGWPVDVNLGAIGIVAGGQTAGSGSGAVVNTIEKFFAIAASGNTTDFGDLSVARHSSSSMGNDTRAIFAGGWDNYAGSSRSNVIDYITYSTSGNATDFGDVAATTSDANCSASNNVRGITFGGRLYSNGNIDNAIEYLTIASTGNMLDFGDLSIGGSYTQRHRQGNGMSGSTTRGLASGGYTPAALSNTIQYVTIANTGNSTDFGDMSSSTDELAHMSSNTRGVIAGGSGGGGTYINTIEYVTIASTGNVTDFGDMTVAKAFLMGASSSTKGFIIGGTPANGITNTINSIETILFSTTGNATDFGDLTTATRSGSANTSGHAAVQDTTFAPAAIGLFGAGYGSSSGANIRYKSAITYIDIASTGNNIMFGDLSVGRDFIYNGTAASTTRGLFAGGYTGSNSDVIDFSTFSTKGKATDFGNLTTAAYTGGISSNSTRAISSGGYTSSTINVIEYVTIASAGNATDFGDLNSARQYTTSAASTTRSVIAGGDPDNNFNNPLNVIEYVTIASTGNATDFGDLTVARYGLAGLSSNTRAVFGGGTSSSAMSTNFLDYITIASTANAQDFGDLTKNHQKAASVSSGTRGVFASAVADDLTMQYITIGSTGDGTDFGDLTNEHYSGSGASNGHGGIA